MTRARSPLAIYDEPKPAAIPSLAIDPFSEAFLEDPWPGLRTIRDAGPVVWLEAYNIVAVARYAEARHVLSNWQGEIILTALARHARSLRLAGDPVRRLNNTLRGLASLPVEVEPA